jgi:hypothetical protein
VRITIGLAGVGNDVYVCAGRDDLEVRQALAAALKGQGIDSITIGCVKVGRVYKNLAELVAVKGEIKQ